MLRSFLASVTRRACISALFRACSGTRRDHQNCSAYRYAKFLSLATSLLPSQIHKLTKLTSTPEANESPGRPREIKYSLKALFGYPHEELEATKEVVRESRVQIGGSKNESLAAFLSFKEDATLIFSVRGRNAASAETNPHLPNERKLAGFARITGRENPRTYPKYSQFVVQELRECIRAEAEALNLFMAEVNVAIAPKSLFENRLPRLNIIVYAIRFLLAWQDSPDFDDVPSLLDFATALEIHQKLMIEKVANSTLTHHEKLSGENILCWHEYQNSDSNIRAVYTELILQYCEYDIYRLWTSDPPQTADTTLRLCGYFTRLNPLYLKAGRHSSRLFHHHLTGEEEKALHEHGVDCCAFVSDSCDWAITHQLPGQTLAEVFQTLQFKAAFPCKVSLSTLRETMDDYMSVVEGMSETLHVLLPPELMG
ncbi:hypothetical protein B0H16DRAFT_1474434 [Mycena metata]|uniref:Uncharacterized protein n=1 Tax=Mycena metata TaxID=1033252 RepID=A0AAD7HGU7_9AGAR|nr:hypothetical protein B0H16DRAFT_1474434 [Mycena metata]